MTFDLMLDVLLLFEAETPKYFCYLYGKFENSCRLVHDPASLVNVT